MRELALPPAGTHDQLAEQVARIMGRPLDRSRPLWELYLIHGLEEGKLPSYRAESDEQIREERRI